MGKGWLLGLGGAVVLAGAGFYFMSQGKDSAVIYGNVQVKRGDLKVSINATGTVQPENRLEIKPPIAGRVETVLVVEGQRVQKGQILAWMSSTERAALLDAARSVSVDEVKRWEELYRATPVVAPISGMIIRRNVESGQTFSSADPILVMSDRLTVKAQVDETDIAQIQLKKKAQIILDAYPAEKVLGKVDQIAFEAKTVNNVTTYIVDVLPDSTPAFMRSGMTANVSFFVDSRLEVLFLPVDAVKSVDGRSTVLIKDPSGQPKELQVESGLSDGKRVEVVSGLNEGDTVLVAQIKLKEKQKGGANPLNPMGGGSRPRGGH